MDNDALTHEKPEVVSIATPFTAQNLAYGAFAFALLLTALYLLTSKKRTKSKGTGFLLVGPSDAGKTSILSQMVYGNAPRTQTSMQPNTSTAQLTPQKSIQITDIPGHPRLRNQFQEHLADTKVLAFVVDANSISRNGPAVAEYLHLVLHALTSLPPSQTQPELLILAHKADLFKTTSANNSASALAVNRVKVILERELEKRRVSHSGGINIEGLGEEGERSDLGGLECGEKEDSAFKFDEWLGGEVTFMGTSIAPGATEKNTEGGLDELTAWLEDNM
jgi:signal recognition particle receptor subunit beta